MNYKDIVSNRKKLAEEITELNKKDRGEVLSKIIEFQKKGKAELNYDLDMCFNLTVIFNSTEDKYEFIKKYKLDNKVKSFGSYVFADDLIEKIEEKK